MPYVFVSYSYLVSCPTAISCGVVISDIPGCHLLQQMSCQWRSQKLLQGLVSQELTAYLSVFDLLLTQWIMAILSKGCKPENFESHNSLKLSFMKIGGLHLNFVLSESFLESNSPDILALCATNLDDSIDSGNFSMRSYLLSLYAQFWMLFYLTELRFSQSTQSSFLKWPYSDG